MSKQKWVFEPGHTSAQFSVRHMMVSNVRGHFKGVEGSIVVDPDDPTTAVVSANIKTKDIWSGESYRDKHLKSADFFDVEKYPEITFYGDKVEVTGPKQFKVTGGLTIRGITKETTLEVEELARWDTPFWEGEVDKGPITRAGFCATTRINRHDFGVSWNSKLDKGGVVVGAVATVTIDIEALLMDDKE